MRSCLAVLILFAVLPGMTVLAAPAPDPWAIWQLAPPPRGETEEQYLKKEIAYMTSHAALSLWWSYLKDSKLPSITSKDDPRPWLAKNLRITEAAGKRRLRFTFRAGTRREQVVILNALLRVNLDYPQRTIKRGEESIRRRETQILEIQQRIKTAQNPQEAAALQEGIDDLRTKVIPALRTAIAREKQFAVIRWAK